MAAEPEDLALQIGKVPAKHNPFSYKKFVSKRPEGDEPVRKSSTKKASASSDVPFPDLADDGMRQPVPQKAGNPFSFNSFLKEKKSTSSGDIKEKKKKKKKEEAVKPCSSESNSPSSSSQSEESDSDLPFPVVAEVDSRRGSDVLPALDSPPPPSISSSSAMEPLPLPPYKPKSKKVLAKDKMNPMLNSQQTLSSEQSSTSDDDDSDGDDSDGDDGSSDSSTANGPLPLPSQSNHGVVEALTTEKFQLSAELQETKQLLLQERKRCKNLEKSVKVLKEKEKQEAQALADMVKKAEDNLKLTTKRAVSAESKVSHLRKEVMILQTKLAKQEQQQGSVSSNQHYEGVLAAVREKASQGAQQIDQSADKAESLLKDLMLGVRSLRQLSDVLLSIDKIVEVKEASSSSSS